MIYSELFFLSLGINDLSTVLEEKKKPEKYGKHVTHDFLHGTYV